MPVRQEKLHLLNIVKPTFLMVCQYLFILPLVFLELPV